MASKMINSLADEDSSDLPSKGHIMSTPSEVVKVSHLYSVLTKVSNGIVRLEALFEALLDLCGVGNAIIVHRSLCILHAVLNHLSGLERKAERSALWSGTMSLLKIFASGTALWIPMGQKVQNLEA